MPKFGALSEERLKGCDPKLQILFREVVVKYDCTVLVGHRGQEAQDKAVREGNSKVSWPNGRHNSKPSMAADVSPYPIEWGGPIITYPSADDARDKTNGKVNEENLRALKRFIHFAGYVQGKASEMGIKLRWGGDWDRDFDLDDQDFNDLVHFEVVGE